MKYNLSYLLENKPFERLTHQEKTFVLSKLNEAEYKLQRTIILQSKIILTDTQKSLIPTVPTKALNQLHKKQKASKKSFMVVLFNHRVPTWAAIAACVLVFLFIKKGLFFENPTNNLTELMPITQTDTVYIEKIETKIKPIYLPADTVTIYKTIEKKHSPTQLKNTNTTATYPSEMYAVENVNYDVIIAQLNKQNGVSAKNDSILQLIGSIVY